MRKRYAIATGAYCAIIWILSSQPGPGDLKLPFLFEGMDKVAHMTLYGGLAALVSVGLHRSGRPVTPWVQAFVPLLFAAAYGVTDEIHQYFVPMRQAELADVLADLAGATIVQCVLCHFWWKGRSWDASGAAS